jgi:hypothetical protein
MISPREVLESMAFGQSPDQESGGEVVSSRLQPKAQPPADPPPLYTEGRNEPVSEHDPLLLPNSYQHGSHPHEHSRQAALPTIQNFQDSDVPADWSYSYGFRGDVSIRPNTGETNSYDYALFGLALHELLEQLRLANMIAASLTIVMLASTWLLKVIMVQWTKAVLSGFLVCFALTLLLVECMNIWKVPSIDKPLRDNFGLIYHPVGKAIYLLGTASFCWALGGIWETILGAVYCTTGGILWVAWIIYPEFRRPYETDDDADVIQYTGPRSASWSYYSTSVSASVGETSDCWNCPTLQHQDTV